MVEKRIIILLLFIYIIFNIKHIIRYIKLRRNSYNYKNSYLEYLDDELRGAPGLKEIEILILLASYCLISIFIIVSLFVLFANWDGFWKIFNL